jgi:hypothetical protein
MKIGQNGLVAGIRSQIFILLRKECLTTDVTALDAGQDLAGPAARLSQHDNLHVQSWQLQLTALLTFGPQHMSLSCVTIDVISRCSVIRTDNWL